MRQGWILGLAICWVGCATVQTRHAGTVAGGHSYESGCGAERRGRREKARSETLSVAEERRMLSHQVQVLKNDHRVG